MKTLPITMLFYDGPIAQAYLRFMISGGLRPARIVHILPKVNNFLVNLLPGKIRYNFLARYHDARMNHWPRIIRKKYPQFFNEFQSELSKIYGVSDDNVSGITDNLILRELCDEYIPLELSKGLRDQKLHSFITQLGKTSDTELVLLYTGGGIVPKKIFEIKGIKLVHIHPGFLPDVRGADGLLWSTLVRAKLGSTAFFMAPGIDTGPIILAQEYPKFTTCLADAEFDTALLYRAVFSYLDPVIRTMTLMNVLKEHNDIAQATVTPQSTAEGITYHFMHTDMKTAALKAIFKEKPSSVE